MNRDSGYSSLVSLYRAKQSAMINMDRFQKTVHGHDYDGTSRVVMVRKTDQRTFSSVKKGEGPKLETVTRETIETFRGRKTERKFTSLEKTEETLDENAVTEQKSLKKTSDKLQTEKSVVKVLQSDGKSNNFALVCLNAHNEYRAKHGVPPMKLSSKISKTSQEWANKLAERGGSLTHSSNREYGENIFCLWSSNGNLELKGNEAVDSWYKEIEMHPFGLEPRDLSSGHFTQVVWKESSELGVAFAKSKTGKVFVVANYYPPGNVLGTFKDNVPPVGGFANHSPKTSNETSPQATVGDFELDALQAHNEYRAKHGVEPLKLNPKISQISQKWADHLAAGQGALQHSNNREYGENLYWSWSSDKNKPVNGREAVKCWYNEIDKHTFGVEPKDLSSGHFTQVVWKSSEEVGLAFAKSSSGGIFIVANYYPPGNLIGAFKTNVLPPGSVCAENVSKAKAKPESEENFEVEVLKAHNEYRALHCVEPLKLDKKLCKYAKEWAKTLASKNSIEHRKDSSYGENIFSLWSDDTNIRISGRKPVDSWYSEIQYHTFGQEPVTLKSGHFTQIVWKATKEIGVGIEKNRQGQIYVVVNYSPPGNFVGSFTRNVPPVGGFQALTPLTPGLLDDEEFVEDVVRYHNECRKKHGVSSLKLSRKLCRYAKEWADTLASGGKFYHRPNNMYGENLFRMKSSDPEDKPTATDVCTSWYDEIKMYSFNGDSSYQRAGHFTQMVWKGSEEIGVAMAKGKSGETYVVANYHPKGNYIGQFTANVLKPR